jgi:hypothetical protein
MLNEGEHPEHIVTYTNLEGFSNEVLSRLVQMKGQVRVTIPDSIDQLEQVLTELAELEEKDREKLRVLLLEATNPEYGVDMPIVSCLGRLNGSLEKIASKVVLFGTSPDKGPLKSLWKRLHDTGVTIRFTTDFRDYLVGQKE